MEKKDEISLNCTNEELEEKIINEMDSSKISEIIDLFNVNIKKKDIIRASKMSSLQDAIFNQIQERIQKHSDEFSNKDLAEYYKLAQDTLDKASAISIDAMTPSIQIQQNNLNIKIGENEYSAESKERIVDAVSNILNKLKAEDKEIVDIDSYVQEEDI